METKPPTRTLPKLVMKEWPEKRKDRFDEFFSKAIGMSDPEYFKALSDFTRVVEEIGVLDQERSQKEKSR